MYPRRLTLWPLALMAAWAVAVQERTIAVAFGAHLLVALWSISPVHRKPQPA